MSIVIHSAGIPVINKAGTVTRKIGVSLTASATVTILAASRDSKFTISPASLNFTPSNFSVPQTLTLTGVNDAVNDDLLLDQLQLSGQGTKNLDVAVIDEPLAAIGFRGRRWIDEVQIQNSADVTTKRTYLIDTIFNGNGIPTNAIPTAVTNGYTGQMHCTNTSQLTNEGSIDKLTFVQLDGQGATWTYYAYVIPPASGSVNKVAYIDEGHVLEGFTELTERLLINSLNAIGWTVVSLAMPQAGDNTESNANVDSSSTTITARHNQILTERIDNSTFSGYQLFLSGHFQLHNYILANYSFTKIVTIGASGGSIMASWMPTLVTNIDATFINRGIVARALFTTDTFGDFEGGGIRENWQTSGLRVWNMFNEVEQIDRLLMSCSGGRKCVIIHKNGDAALQTAYGWNNLPWRNKLAEYALARVNGELIFNVNNGATETSHEWHQNDINNYVIPELP